MEPTAGSGSGAAEPVEEDRIPEPASSNARRATPLHLEQAGGGADGSTSAMVVDPRKGKQTVPPLPPRVIPSSSSSAGSSGSSSSTRSLDYAGAFGDGVAESGTAAGGRKARVAETREVPNAPLDPKLVARQRFIERPMKAQAAVDKERLIQKQTANEEANRRWEQQQEKLSQVQVGVKVRTKQEKLPQVKRKSFCSRFKNKEKLSQVQVGVKVRPKQDKLPQVKGKSFWSRFKNKIFCRTTTTTKPLVPNREICSEHVKHQTHPITEARRYHQIASDESNHLDAYSEFRPVIGDGECFYRSFIFSYLEQVIDRQDTHEEHRLLHVVERVPTQPANLGWNSEFSRSCREMHNCLTVVACRHSFTQCWHKLKFEAYCEDNNSIAFKELIEKVMEWKSTESTSSCRKQKLLKFFSTYDKTRDIFTFLRLLVAIEICSQRDVYGPIVQGPEGNYSLEVWCLGHVIPARVDADHVMMVALASALDVPLRVESFQRGYAPDIYTCHGVSRPSVTLLYTGHHYDIIYPRAPSAESSSHQASQREDRADQSSSHQASQREDPADESSSHQAS